MRIVSHDRLRDPRDFQATQLVVYDRFGRPLVALLEELPDQVTVLTRGMAEFEALLRAWGIDAGTRVIDVAPPEIRL